MCSPLSVQYDTIKITAKIIIITVKLDNVCWFGILQVIDVSTYIMLLVWYFILTSESFAIHSFGTYQTHCILAHTRHIARKWACTDIVPAGHAARNLAATCDDLDL